MGCRNQTRSPWWTVKVEFFWKALVHMTHCISLINQSIIVSIHPSTQAFDAQKCKISQSVWSTCIYSCVFVNPGHFENNVVCRIGFHGWSVPATQHLLCGVEHTVISPPCSSIHFVKLSAWPALLCYECVRYIASGLRFCALTCWILRQHCPLSIFLSWRRWYCNIWVIHFLLYL